MAGDTRDSPAESPPEEAHSSDSSKAGRKKPKHEFPQTQAGKMWEAFGNPEEPINMMPGGTYNSAGGKPKEVTLTDAFKFSPEEFKRLHKMPCSRDSLLVGLGAGFGVGGIRAILGGLRSFGSAANWAVGTFCLSAAGMYTFCQQRRREEAQGMAQAVQRMAELKAKKQKEREEAEAEAARLREEERKKSWTNIKNYKFW